jgi:ATP-dependent DNA helicase RecQ
VLQSTGSGVADADLLDRLRTVFGFSGFRPLQESIVRAILAGQDAFVLMPTGGGKSLCYQLPALLLDGLTVVVSPLIALMKDQVDALQALGVAATYINSSLDREEIARRQWQVARGQIKLLYVAPERLTTPGFLQLLAQARPALFAVDEAHCISEWGHDFRPEYRALKVLRERFPEVPLGAFTATATSRVQADIVAQLGLGRAASFRGSFNRANLFYQVQPKSAPYRQLITYLREHPGGSGIIYCASRAGTEALAERLRADGFRAAAYHAGLDSAERQARQDAFIRDNVQIMVATIAFGMGIDKPDVRFVVHYDLPKNLESYYQESGRAGRDGEPSNCILFYSYGDALKFEHFIDEKSPSEQVVARQQLRQMVEWADGVTCRRRALLNYFGDELAGQIGRCCDLCDDPQAVEDFTVPAQMLLSCVKRTGERFGMTYVVDVLRGSKNERITSLGHDRLPTYGIGADRPKELWQHVLFGLLRQGQLRQTGEYNVLEVTETGYAVLFKGTRVALPKPRPAATKARKAPAERSGAERAGATVERYHEPLFEELRALRKRLADARGLPPYVIFPDTTLKQMAAHLPGTSDQLLRLHGVGQQRLRDFGEQFLATVVGYVQRTGAEPLTVGPAAGGGQGVRNGGRLTGRTGTPPPWREAPPLWDDEPELFDGEWEGRR